jgi:DNA polymerase III epsilon subunit-like protein
MERAVEYVQETLDRYDAEDTVLVGHYFSLDQARLEEAGVEIDEDIVTFDTANLERAWSRRVNGRRTSLKSICEKMEVPYYRENKLGNAGNDAFFSMAIFAEMCCLEGDE